MQIFGVPKKDTHLVTEQRDKYLPFRPSWELYRRLRYPFQRMMALTRLASKDSI
jgi:hypothetical protein